MPRIKISRACGCGCGQLTRGGVFSPGHDTKVYRAILQHIDGDILKLKALVEGVTGGKVIINHDENRA